MMIKRFLTSGTYKTNTYIVQCEETGSALVIDPGSECEQLFEYIEDNGINIVYVINTHAHHDHCGGIAETCKRYNCSFLTSEKEQKLFKGITTMKLIPECPEPEQFISEGDTFSIGRHSFTVMETPGHTDGSISIITNKTLFTGDLFTYERDEGLNISIEIINKATEETVAQKILSLTNKNIMIYPGHGPAIKLEDLERWL
ncbi:MAG: MBL fold metallo-hydrolase [bacterium]|nr:MBL fold metallo-hydrolase [bacterium]